MENDIYEILKTTHILNIEAEEKDILDILSKLSSPIAYLEADSALYEQMNVKQYLTYFANLLDKKQQITMALENMHLLDFLHTKIKNCNPSIRKRILIAREIIKNAPLYVFHKPLEHVDDDSRRIIFRWMESLENGPQKLIAITQSHKDICICPGAHYEYTQGKFICIDQNNEENNSNEAVIINKISVSSNDKIFLFNPEQIDYLEAVGGKVFVYVEKESYTCTLKLDILQTKLEKFGFYRCHRSYLVNMQKVTQVVRWSRSSYSLKLTGYDEQVIPLSKTKIQELKEMYEF